MWWHYRHDQILDVQPLKILTHKIIACYLALLLTFIQLHCSYRMLLSFYPLELFQNALYFAVNLEVGLPHSTKTAGEVN